jgi:hypothetical protein
MDVLVLNTVEKLNSIFDELWKADVLGRKMIHDVYYINTYYARKQLISFESRTYIVYCIANISLKLKSNGIFRKHLNYIISKNIPIFVESIIEPRLEPFLTNLGFKVKEDYGMVYIPNK